MTTTTEDRIPERIDFALTLSEVMADLDAGWDECSAEAAGLDSPSVVDTVR